MASVNETPLTDEQRAIAGDPRHVSLATAIADRLARRAPRERECYRAEALYGLASAARGYRPELGCFEAFAVPRIYGAVLDYARKQMRRGFTISRKAIRAGLLPQSVSTAAAVAFGEHDALTVGDCIDSGELPVGWEAEAEDAVCVFASHLPFRFGEMVRRAFLDCDAPNYRAVSRSMGLSADYLNQAIYTRFGEVRGG